MRKMWCSLLLGLACAVCTAARAQQIVHAVSGVVTAVDPAKMAITLKTNDGSVGDFQYEKQLRSDIVFDKELRGGTAVPAGFNKIGDHVVAYYYAGEAGRTLVAIKDFGAAPLQVASGTVVKAKRHEITIKTDDGATETFDIAKDASAETPSGVVSGFKFEADQGTRVTVRYTEANGTKIAEFIRNAFG